MDACPHCGSDKGFCQLSTARGESLGSWDSPDDRAPLHLDFLWVSSMVSCITCRKRTKLSSVKAEVDHA